MLYVADNKRHLVCIPYSLANLHSMARELGVKKGWYENGHYDIPARRIDEILSVCVVVSPKLIVRIRRGEITTKEELLHAARN